MTDTRGQTTCGMVRHRYGYHRCMAVAKILLFYTFRPVPDPEAVRLWQRELCERHGLRGRIILSPQGINGTLGGELGALKRYVRTTREFPPFKDIDFKWSEGTGFDADGGSREFPRLSVKVREELVTFGAPAEIEVDAQGVVGTGAHLTPEQLHELLAQRDDAVFFDGRNTVEARIGRFRDAVVPETGTTRDFLTELESGRYDALKDKPVITYCTGGIRCEVLSALMLQRGFREVYQLAGGIVRYGEAFGNEGLWRGALTVFDGREQIEFGGPGSAEVLGRCDGCGAPTHRLQNCSDASCRERLVVCEGCAEVAHCTRHAEAA